MNKKQLQGFLGVCGFSRRFVHKHSDYVSAFRDLLSSKQRWNWTSDHETAFENIKKNFINAVTLHHVLPGYKFRLQTDASDVGISGILQQVDDKGEAKIVSLTSRVLTKQEIKYTVTEKELLAIIFSLLKFRKYLLGVRFEILTDHKALTFMLKTPHHNARITRWVLFAQEYDFEILHCKGSENIIADYFSRNFAGQLSDNSSKNKSYLVSEIGKKCVELINENDIENKLIASLEMKTELFNDLHDFAQHQEDDLMIKCLREKKETSLSFHAESGVLYCKSKNDQNFKLLIPSNFVPTLLSSIHDQLGHAGSYKMHRYIAKFFYWKYMRRDIKNFTKSCDVCQKTKYLNYKMEGVHEFVSAKKPNELVSVDFYGPLPGSTSGVQYILVLQDIFSKFVTLYAIKRATTQICLKKLINQYFNEVGKPERILSDNGTQFTAHAWRETLEAQGIKIAFSSVRHPQSNPVERTMRELGRIFRTYCAGKHTSWGRHVSFAQDCLNYSFHMSTGEIPYELHFGRSVHEKIYRLFPLLEPRPIDRKFQIEMANERLRTAFEKRRQYSGKKSKIDLKVDDLVLARVPHLSDKSERLISKFFHLYEGPFRIVEQIGNNAFELVELGETPRMSKIVNRFHLKKYYERNDVNQSHQPS